MERLIINGIDFDLMLDIEKTILLFSIDHKFSALEKREDFWFCFKNLGVAIYDVEEHFKRNITLPEIAIT